MKCHAEIVQVENALTHVTSFLEHVAAIDKLSLYESRLNRNIARNTDLFNKRQAERGNQQTQPTAAQAHEAEPRTQIASAVAHSRSGLIPTETKAKMDASGQPNGFVPA